MDIAGPSSDGPALSLPFVLGMPIACYIAQTVPILNMSSLVQAKAWELCARILLTLHSV